MRFGSSHPPNSSCGGWRDSIDIMDRSIATVGMGVYEGTTWVDASFESVWDFHSDIRGLISLTPDWLQLQIESVVGPEGNQDPAVLEPGTVVQASVQPVGLGPRLNWTSRITAWERSDSTGMYRDVMTTGPLPRWIHTHRFYEEAGGTRIIDRVEYRLPLGSFKWLSRVAWVGLEPLFRYRHRKTQSLLE